jgi:hypothetical protein
VARNPNLARRGPKKQLDVNAAKARVLDLLARGVLVSAAMKDVGRKSETYRDWRKNDPDFRARVDYLRDVAGRGRDGGSSEPVPDFPEFASTYLGQPLGEHQLRIWDALEGREPRSLHPAMRFRAGWPERLIINMPPSHAKSTTWTVNYVVWRIHRDPNVKIIVISKSQPMAKKFLGAIKFRLTSPLYRDMHTAFAPNGGWRDPDNSWTTTEIYVQGKGDGEKDPTVQCLGLRGQIYGARADLIICDDIVTLENVGQYEPQIDWLTQEVISRLPEDEQGLLLVCGTRVAAVDLYKVLRDEFVDFDGNHVFNYFSQPAVLEYADRPQDWVTLWPSTTNRKGETVRKWDGRALSKRRAEMRDDRRWALIYQQADVADRSTFPPEAVEASVNGRRNPGPLKPGAWGHLVSMEQCYVIGGLDPATTGYTAALVYAVERRSGRRYVLDGYNRRHTTPAELRSMMKAFTTQYGIREWRVETNAFQRSIVQDEDLTQWLYANGAVIRGHYTTGSKYDEDFGVASMAPLFLSCVTADPANGRNWTRNPDGLIELPNKRLSQVVTSLCEQLVVWQPGQKHLIQDLVMALWFCEIAAREYIGVGAEDRMSHMDSPFLSRRDKALQVVVDLNELEAEAASEGLVI